MLPASAVALLGDAAARGGLAPVQYAPSLDPYTLTASSRLHWQTLKWLEDRVNDLRKEGLDAGPDEVVFLALAGLSEKQILTEYGRAASFNPNGKNWDLSLHKAISARFKVAPPAGTVDSPNNYLWWIILETYMGTKFNGTRTGTWKRGDQWEDLSNSPFGLVPFDPVVDVEARVALEQKLTDFYAEVLLYMCLGDLQEARPDMYQQRPSLLKNLLKSSPWLFQEDVRESARFFSSETYRQLVDGALFMYDNAVPSGGPPVVYPSPLKAATTAKIGSLWAYFIADKGRGFKWVARKWLTGPGAYAGYPLTKEEADKAKARGWDIPGVYGSVDLILQRTMGWFGCPGVALEDLTRSIEYQACQQVLRGDTLRRVSRANPDFDRLYSGSMVAALSGPAMPRYDACMAQIKRNMERLFALSPLRMEYLQSREGVLGYSGVTNRFVAEAQSFYVKDAPLAPLAIEEFGLPTMRSNYLTRPKFTRADSKSFLDIVTNMPFTFVEIAWGKTALNVGTLGYYTRAKQNTILLVTDHSKAFRRILQDFVVGSAAAVVLGIIAVYSGVAGPVMQSMGGFTPEEMAWADAFLKGWLGKGLLAESGKEVEKAADAADATQEVSKAKEAKDAVEAAEKVKKAAELAEQAQAIAAAAAAARTLQLQKKLRDKNEAEQARQARISSEFDVRQAQKLTQATENSRSVLTAENNKLVALRQREQSLIEAAGGSLLLKNPKVADWILNNFGGLAS